MFKNFITPKKIDKIKNETLLLTDFFLNRINNYDWRKINNSTYSSQIFLFFFILEFYRQLLTIKYSKFYTETACRTIINSLSKTYQIDLLNHFILIQNEINKIFNSNEDGVYNLSEKILYELGFTEEEIYTKENLLTEVYLFLELLINIPYDYIDTPSIFMINIYIEKLDEMFNKN